MNELPPEHSVSGMRSTLPFPERPFWQLISVRFREFIREPEAIFWSFLFPMLLAVGLGVAFRNRPPEVVKIGVVAPAASANGADSLVTWLNRAPGVQAVTLTGDTAASTALRDGSVALVATSRADGTVEYTFDDTRPESRMARLVADEAIQRAAGRMDAMTVSELHVRERGSRYIDFLIPGLLGMNIMGGGMWSVGFSIVDARRKHLLKRLVATPMSRALYLLSFVVTRLLFLVVEVAGLLAFAVLLFDVPVRGSLVQIAGVAVLASLTFTGLGLLVSSRVRTIEGASGFMNLVMMPMWVLSGIFFSATNFPAAFQPIIQALPLTAAIDALRMSMLQGLGLHAIAGELLIMAIWLVVSFTVALKLFRWR